MPHDSTSPRHSPFPGFRIEVRLSAPLRGMLYGVPVTLVLWALILWSAARAFTHA